MKTIATASKGKASLFRIRGDFMMCEDRDGWRYKSINQTASDAIK